MVNENTVLIIADSWEYLQFYIKDKMNLKIVLFQSPERRNRVKMQLCEEIRYLDLKDKVQATALAKKLNEKYNFRAVWSFTDEGVELASKIGKTLGLTHNPENVSILVNNKERLRSHLKQQGFEEVKYRLILNEKELLEFSNESGFPIIIKPHNGSASKDVVKINNKVELDQYITKHKINDLNLIVEEYLSGQEFSIETISFDGHHEIIQITEKHLFPNTNVEMQHSMPANISFKTRTILENYIIKLLNIIGQRTGPCHIEIKLTPKGPKIIEAHTRPGGDFIVLLLADIFGVDVICETLKFVMVGEKPNRFKQEGVCGIVKYFYNKPGKIKNIEGFDEIVKHPKVINYELCFNIGEHVPELTHSFSRNGCLVIKDSSVDSATKLADELISEIKLTII